MSRMPVGSYDKTIDRDDVKNRNDSECETDHVIVPSHSRGPSGSALVHVLVAARFWGVLSFAFWVIVRFGSFET